jgi:hypothetical protein
LCWDRFDRLAPRFVPDSIKQAQPTHKEQIDYSVRLQCHRIFDPNQR